MMNAFGLARTRTLYGTVSTTQVRRTGNVTRRISTETATNGKGNSNNHHFPIARRGLRSLSSKPGKPKPKPSVPGNGGVERTWYTSAGRKTTSGLDMGRYGLKRLDYAGMTPPVWTAPPHPPTKTTAERVVFPLTLALVAGMIVWVYMAPEEEDMAEYWKRVESGQILLDDDDDYDEDDDDYDDE